MGTLGGSMIRGAGALFLFTFVLNAAQPVSARPEYLTKFQADPFRRAEVDGCGTCHVNNAGGGARNDFGGAFEAAAQEITPLLRANFPQQFRFDTVKLPDGSLFSFSDPKGQFVVVERENQKVLADLTTLGAPRAAPLPMPENRMGFFVASEGLSHGGHLGGLAGADRHCQNLAKAAGADDRTWRAYLSTSFAEKPAVNAGDRIGSGPWYNAKGVLVARGPADLHAKDHFRPELLLTEKGDSVGASGGNAGARLKIVTGSLPNGTAAVGMNCRNWTSEADGEALAGELTGSWNSATTISCGRPTSREAAPEARLYCFAAK
ncbi:MAG: hypothetical protein LC791_14040 [Acidobacteria bacterium]|nr:hypothetical protein [Acidobacteriota bacterium]